MSEKAATGPATAPIEIQLPIAGFICTVEGHAEAGMVGTLVVD